MTRFSASHSTSLRYTPISHLCQPVSVAAACLLLCLPPATLQAQTNPEPQPQPAPTTLTDTIARAFTSARAQAHLRPLTRIPDRPLLRQITCTAAAGKPSETTLARESQADGALFSITDPAHLPADIKRVAEYDDRSSARGRRITRFSVAAFTSPADPSVTWVGIALYWGRFTEYFALHYTRSYYPINPQLEVVPACRSVR